MGNDGGSIPTRRELTKTAARHPTTTEQKATQQESQTHAWTNCPLSHKPLVPPIVSDYLGVLYNKDAVIELLLPSTDPDAPARTAEETVVAARVKGLRDVVEVRFMMGDGGTEGVKEGAREEKKLCPITSKELGASTKAVYLVPCGHAFSEVAVREMASESCSECNEPYTTENIVTILPLAKEDVARLEARMERLRERGLTHALKKAPGSKKKKSKATSETAGETTAAMPTEKHEAARPSSSKKRSHQPGEAVPAPSNSITTTSTTSHGIKNAATANLAAKVVAEQEMLSKRRKVAETDNIKSLFSKPDAGASDFMTRGFAIPRRI